MSIPRCKNRPTSQYHGIAVSQRTFDEIKAKIDSQEYTDEIVEDDNSAVLVVSKYVFVRKQA